VSLLGNDPRSVASNVAILSGSIDGVAIGLIVPSSGNFTTVDINGGTLDGVVIGGSVAAAGTFTTGTFTNVIVNGTFTSLGIGDNATSNAITISATENVGIGNTNPQVKLHVGIDQYLGIGRIELAADATADGLSLIDFHSEDSASPVYADYNSRIIQGTGENGGFQLRHRGTGSLLLITEDAADMEFIVGSSGNVKSITINGNNGVVGVGTNIPNDNWAQLPVIQMGSAQTIWGGGGAGNAYGLNLTDNAYFDGTNDKFIFFSKAAKYQVYLGEHIWYTSTATGAPPASVTFLERMRIDNAGRVKINTSSGYTEQFSVKGQAQTVGAFRQDDTHAILTGNSHTILNTRAASSAYAFSAYFSGGGGDKEFAMRGDGNAFADGSWAGGGADYAEYFEWDDANPLDEDRAGLAVVLVGSKIREATTGETPFGIISANPTITGDGAWNKWADKYLRDDYNRYILENYDVLQWTDSEGNDVAYDADNVPPEALPIPPDAVTVVQQRRKLNPSYDPDQTYIPREDRKEWDAVGMMGKLTLNVGQEIASSWVKLKDITVGVTEQWLVK